MDKRTFRIAHICETIFFVEDQLNPGMCIVLSAPTKILQEDEGGTIYLENEHQSTPLRIPIVDGSYLECRLNLPKVPREFEYI